MSETAQKGKVVYSVEKGRIFRDDGHNKESVALYEENTGIVEMLPEKRQYRVAVIRHLNDKGHKYETTGKIGMDIDRSKAPPKPKKSRIQGEKTPAVVEWYAKYFKEEFLEKYAVRELQVRTGYRTEEKIHIDKRSGDRVIVEEKIPVYQRIEGFDYDIEKLKTGEQRLVGDCKTSLTEKYRSGVESEEYDEDLDDQIQQELERKRRGGLV